MDHRLSAEQKCIILEEKLEYVEREKEALQRSRDLLATQNHDLREEVCKLKQAALSPKTYE